MSLNTSLNRVLTEYSGAIKQPFTKHALAAFIRRELVQSIRDAIGANDRYLFKGSPGQGTWVGVPWAAVFDRLVTESAQEGFYLVYLFTKDGSGVYLSLNQGVTTVRKQYGRDTARALNVRAADYLARIGKLEPGVIAGPIDLRAEAGDLGADYEQGAICSLFYAAQKLPSDAVLGSDLKLFLDYYFGLVSKESFLFDQSQLEDDETGLDFEDFRMLRVHKRVERNKSLAAEAKRRLGLTCQACGFTFRSFYGDLGEGYIEAHHLTPVAELRGKRVQLDPVRDFAVLCSNCHRMVHRSEYISDIESFRKNVLLR